MAITERDKERLNYSMPIANDVKLGDIIQELQSGGGTQGPKGDRGDPGPQGPKGDKGDKGASGEVTQAAFDALAARVAALEAK